MGYECPTGLHGSVWCTCKLPHVGPALKPIGRVISVKDLGRRIEIEAELFKEEKVIVARPVVIWTGKTALTDCFRDCPARAVLNVQGEVTFEYEGGRDALNLPVWYRSTSPFREFIQSAAEVMAKEKGL